MPALLTAEQFFMLPDPEEGGKLELVDGRVRAFPPWFLGPSMTRANLAFALSELLKPSSEVHVLMSVAGLGVGAFRFPVEEVFAS